MFPSFVISLITSLHLWLTGGFLEAPVPTVIQAAQTRVAQAAPAATPASRTDRAARQVVAIRGERRAAVAEKSLVQAAHNKHLAEVDRLKKRRASWRRDRQLKKELAASQQTAASASKVARRIRAIDQRLENAYRQLRAAVAAESRAGGLSSARRARLVSWAREARQALHRDKKIVLPDYQIDPLADPEDLEYQAARIAQTEKQLMREINELTARAERFDRMTKLREKASRAAELSGFDDDRPRRTTGRTGSSGDRGQGGAGAGADAEADDNAGSPLDADPASEPSPPGGGGSGFSDSSDPTVVLADVVDAGTLNALRRAESSGNPAARAKAAARARRAVQAQLERARKARQAIQRRAKALRGN